ncbi:Xaa-Pro aminopeptidase [Planctomicrobium piriforme]|uniref:Xaa-Pro aminopeptidase n=1 Tax=Planctomicrobium piriforme TaxID=1576369 RepID=A0A1I3F9Y5_9PLAN|nr:Xaa-Pro aminopeptidase [Planctomicrobium piriforme]
MLDTARAEEVGRRHAAINEFLRSAGFDGLLIQDPTNYAWLTCGGDNSRRGNAAEPVAAILVTPEARVVLCNNVDSGQIFDRDLMGLGFLLKERPWTEDLTVLRLDVCRGRKIVSDRPFLGIEQGLADLRPLRQQLGSREVQQLRDLGREVAHAIEATARNFEAGATEAEIAGHLAHRLLKRQIQPASLQVMADAQGWRYRHWAYGTDRVERHCVISAIGRRHGLHAGATRTVCIGAPSDELQKVHRLATLVQATGIYFSQPGWTMEETWKRVARIYEKFDVPDEWRCAEQAEIIGYSPSEMPVLPHSQQPFQAGTAVFWHPSVRSSLVGDTVLVAEGGCEILTPSQNWPVISVKVKGATVERPSLLIREMV